MLKYIGTSYQMPIEVSSEVIAIVPPGHPITFILRQKWEATYEPINRLATKEVIVFEQPEGSYNFGEELREATAEIGPTVLVKIMDARVDGLQNMDFPNVKPVTVESNESWGKRHESAALRILNRGVHGFLTR
ncbi:hypothetical protein M747DRAFT_304757 [Aspergillus niger ATCC 13496]|uniref:Uncharacterized protein n=1 Tax=Aspergillus niger ATCC 13496 TaxID=1353008 RepID=A0A370C330_ASPNG|nr:hypothetical protein M747DRAFT_304757 [Aspergillus niger ATCC 13496]